MGLRGSKFAYNRLQEAVCNGMGFCGSVVDGKPSHVDDYIPESGEVTADQFIDWLFKAEGMGYPPDFGPRFSSSYKDLKHLFIKHMGSERVDASRLKWDV